MITFFSSKKSFNLDSIKPSAKTLELFSYAKENMSSNIIFLFACNDFLCTNNISIEKLNAFKEVFFKKGMLEVNIDKDIMLDMSIIINNMIKNKNANSFTLINLIKKISPILLAEALKEKKWHDINSSKTFLSRTSRKMAICESNEAIDYLLKNGFQMFHDEKNESNIFNVIK